MPDYSSIIKEHAKLFHFAGDPGNKNEKDDEEKRTSLVNALDIRKNECIFRSRVAMSILLLALLTLIYCVLVKPDELQVFKELSSVLGGGTIIGLLIYILSVRDEITKIKQTLVIVPAIDSATLATMLLTLSSK
ncbi:MAG TPA: hypothetical protein VKR32_19500 [Puia sp.]|nr:hypothetical protein [Puia sp.]